ncbi:hypothetical protein [Nioella aestuarii]|uniref:hypothetical protein n=1 Tax=Nioella aestuarii TaxID=1662864 RepID=UPI003D7FE988
MSKSQPATAFCAAAVMAVLATPAMACVIPLPDCPLDGGGIAYLNGDNAGAVHFTEQHVVDGRTEARSVLVECTSRQGIAIEEPDSWDDRYYDAYDLMSDALFSEQAVTLRALTRDIRALGVEVQRITLPEGHCGCDLPNMPLPEYYCPEF